MFGRKAERDKRAHDEAFAQARDEAARMAAKTAATTRTTITPMLTVAPVLWGVYIEEYERVGWRLEHWTVALTGMGVYAFPVFARSETEVPLPTRAPSAEQEA